MISDNIKQENGLAKDLDLLLLEYAAGVLDEAHRSLIASFLSLDPQASNYIRCCESLGGALMEWDCRPVPMEEGSLESVLSRLDELDKNTADMSGMLDEIMGGLALPKPIHHFFDPENAFKTPQWRQLKTGIDVINLEMEDCPSKIILTKIAPGKPLPGYRYEERAPLPTRGLTLMLEGLCHDTDTEYGQGDLFFLECCSSDPVADPGMGCFYMTAACESFAGDAPGENMKKNLIQFIRSFLKK